MSDLRCFLYRSDCPQGEVFVGEEAIEAAEKDGWVDSPVGLGGEAPSPEPESPDESEPDQPEDEPAEDSEDVSE